MEKNWKSCLVKQNRKNKVNLKTRSHAKIFVFCTFEKSLRLKIFFLIKSTTKDKNHRILSIFFKLYVLCLVFGLKQKNRHEIALKTFDKLLPVAVLFTDSLV